MGDGDLGGAGKGLSRLKSGFESETLGPSRKDVPCLSTDLILARSNDTVLGNDATRGRSTGDGISGSSDAIRGISRDPGLTGLGDKTVISVMGVAIKVLSDSAVLCDSCAREVVSVLPLS